VEKRENVPNDKGGVFLVSRAKSTAYFYRLGEKNIVFQAPSPVSLKQQQKIWAIAELLHQTDGITEIVPGMNNLTIQFSPEEIDVGEALCMLEKYWESEDIVEYRGRSHEISVKYGGQYGPDLAGVATRCQMSIEEVVHLHTEPEYTVYFLGFQPGFAYLGGLSERLATPRHASPRTSVPAGSVGIGGVQTGIYPRESPGGWQIIGHTEICLFDPYREQPSLWLPGDRVKFIVQEICRD
jgi:KipI family sensor histidine kinase inhibitor